MDIHCLPRAVWGVVSPQTCSANELFKPFFFFLLPVLLPKPNRNTWWCGKRMRNPTERPGQRAANSCLRTTPLLLCSKTEASTTWAPKRCAIQAFWANTFKNKLCHQLKRQSDERKRPETDSAGQLQGFPGPQHLVGPPLPCHLGKVSLTD